MDIGKRVMAREMTLLGGWLGVGLPSWGKVKTHLDRVNPFWVAKHLDGGASRAIAATRSLGHLANAWSVEHRYCLGCFLRRRPSYVTARVIGIIRGDERGRLGDTILLVVVGLLEATLNGDHSLRVGHLKL